MILKKMVIENFRQFKGRQEIVFAEGSTSRKSPCITVLYGENGRGKTGIYRALMFGLYGESKLSQDEQIKTNELSLVNRHMMEQQPEEPVKAVVEIIFTHNNCLYNLHRELSGVKKKNGEFLEQAGEALLRIQNTDGNTSTYDEPQDIRQAINKVLDFRVREYFLFDGEKIERLTRANLEQRREVSSGIRNLLNIDDLEKSIKAAEKLCRELDQDVKNKSSGELQQVIQEINTKEDKLQNLRDKIELLGKELKQAQREKKDIDEKLKQYQEIRELVEERKNIEDQQSELRERLVSLESDCRQKSPRVALGLIKDILQKVYDNIDARREKGDIPPVLRWDLIQQLVESHTCICGRDLNEGTESYQKILEWKSKTPKSNETDAALHIWKQLDAILREIPVQHSDAKNHLMQYADSKAKLQRLETRIESIAEQIGTNQRSDAVELDKIRERLEQKQIKLTSEQIRAQEELEDIQLLLQDFDRKRQLLENDASIRDTLIRRSQMAREIRDALKDVFESFKIEASQLIGQLATQIMESLLDDEGRKNLRGIVIEDNYSLQIINQWNNPFLADISYGQRQIVSISFITALAKAASGDSILEMPLFMDTPFGRLSLEHRNNLIREIPKLSSQWILLATDTELRQEEAQEILK
jgi:DNA sulfur modification protein DndD